MGSSTRVADEEGKDRAASAGLGFEGIYVREDLS
jgi:hypothetical protein